MCERELSYRHWINIKHYAVGYFTEYCSEHNPILKKPESQQKFYDGATMTSIGKYSLYTKIMDKFFKLCFEILSIKYLEIRYYQ